MPIVYFYSFFDLGEGLVYIAAHPGRSTPCKDQVPIVKETAWVPESFWAGMENLASHRDSISGTSSPVASPYTDYAIKETLHIQICRTK